jgi:hypothetical protein
VRWCPRASHATWVANTACALRRSQARPTGARHGRATCNVAQSATSAESLAMGSGGGRVGGRARLGAPSARARGRQPRRQELALPRAAGSAADRRAPSAPILRARRAVAPPRRPPRQARRPPCRQPRTAPPRARTDTKSRLRATCRRCRRRTNGEDPAHFLEASRRVRTRPPRVPLRPQSRPSSRCPPPLLPPLRGPLPR